MVRKKRKIGFYGMGDEDDDQGSEALDQALNEPDRRVDWKKVLSEMAAALERMHAAGNFNNYNQALLAILISRLGEQVSDLQDELRKIAPE